jgi:hypothetical protein
MFHSLMPRGSYSSRNCAIVGSVLCEQIRLWQNSSKMAHHPTNLESLKECMPMPKEVALPK